MEKLAITHIDSGWMTYAVAFMVLDFAGYWVHRISHEYNFFWNNHIIHHSSEEFNLACALRQSVSVVVKVFAFFLIPAAFLGVPSEVIAIVAPLHLFAQFWYHTQHIGRMGFLEKIIVTPSHHRVHHAINPIYLDKNYSQIFIFWDKLFGTFQEELPSVPCVYGVTRPVRTWNPIKINFMHVWLLIKDAWRAQSYWDKLRIWFMPLGWRPEDVAAKHPVYKISDVYNFEKYDPVTSSSLMAWCWVQITMVLLFISYLFGNIAAIGNPTDLLMYGGFVFLSVYAYTELMDKNQYSVVWEIIKNVYGAAILFTTGDWFGISALAPGIVYGLYGYFVISTIVTLWFSLQFQKENSQMTQAIINN
jgi:hypothetical protein